MEARFAFFRSKLQSLLDNDLLIEKMYPLLTLEEFEQLNLEKASSTQIEDLLNARIEGNICLFLLSDEKFNYLKKEKKLNPNIIEKYEHFQQEKQSFSKLNSKEFLGHLQNGNWTRENDFWINDIQLGSLDFSLLDKTIIMNLLFNAYRIVNDNKSYLYRKLKKDRIFLLSEKQIVEALRKIDDYSLISEIAQKTKESILQKIDLSQLPVIQARYLIDLRLNDFSDQQIQYAAEKNLLELDHIRNIKKDLIQKINFKKVNNLPFYCFRKRLSDLTVTQLDNLLIYNRIDNDDEKSIKEINIHTIPLLSPLAIEKCRLIWAPKQIAAFNNKQVEYLMQWNVVTWQMLPHLKPEVLQQVDKQILQSWLNSELVKENRIWSYEFETKNEGKKYIKLLNEKQLEAIKSLSLDK